MTWDEALAELRLEPEALAALAPAERAETVRRAYLRRIRQAPPERDTAGFLRARAAFELLRGPSSGSSGSSASSGASGPRAPRSSRPVERPGSSGEGMLAAWARRHSQALAKLARPCPHEGADGTTLLTTAGELADAGAVDAASELGELALRRLTLQPEGRAEGAVQVLLDLVLLLLRDAHLDEARHLGVLAEEWLATQRMAQVLADEVERWIFTRELLALPHGFSAKLRRALALALLTREGNGIVLAFKRHRLRADYNAGLLADHTPLLHAAYLEMVDDDWNLEWSIRVGAVLIVALIVLLRWLLSGAAP